MLNSKNSKNPTLIQTFFIIHIFIYIFYFFNKFVLRLDSWRSWRFDIYIIISYKESPLDFDVVNTISKHSLYTS